MTTTVNNEHKNIKVPNLRFPEFQGEWEKYELNDICETITDFVAAGSFASLRENVTYYQEDNYAQLVRTIDLKNNFSNNEFVYVDKGAYDFLWRVQLIEPNIVFTKYRGKHRRKILCKASKSTERQERLRPQCNTIKK